MCMRVAMEAMRIRMRRKKNRKPMIDQLRIWVTEGIVLEPEGIVPESVKIGQYIADM